MFKEKIKAIKRRLLFKWFPELEDDTKLILLPVDQNQDLYVTMITSKKQIPIGSFNELGREFWKLNLAYDLVDTISKNAKYSFYYTKNGMYTGEVELPILKKRRKTINDKKIIYS